MKSLSAILVLVLMLLAGIPKQTVSRGLPSAVEVPVATFADPLLVSGVGNANRKADHATVAINDSLDVVVAFHTSRDDITQFGNMKQVEFAYYEYQVGTDSWVWVNTFLLGSVDYRPIQGLIQNKVKCERPDVIAVGDRFFVTWTRRYYEGDPGAPIIGQELAPAVLECAWIEKPAGQPVEITGYPASGNPSRGFALDSHVPGGQPAQLFQILECSGVPDAVVLNDSSLTGGSVKVAVVYPHQTVFSDNQASPPDLDREFDMRLVTCTLDPSGPSNVITSTPYERIIEAAPFNGITSPGGNASAGLVLPDCAPSSEDNAFWLIAESQVETQTAPPLPSGIIKVGYWEATNSGANWEVQAMMTFKSKFNAPLPNYEPPMIRRRPMISSYPSPSNPSGVQTASIAFSLRDPDPAPVDPTANVFCVEVQYRNGSIIAPFPLISEWPNSSQYNDGKPVPLHGLDSPKLRRCLSERTEAGMSLPSSILSYDSVSEVFTTLETLIQPGIPVPPGEVGRPAASYKYKVGGAGISPDYMAVSFEKRVTMHVQDPLRIWFGVAD